MVLRHSAMQVAIASVLYVFLSSGVPTVDAQGLSASINEGDAINGVIGTNTTVTVTCSTTGATSVTWLAPNGFTINPAVSASKYSINFNSITGISTLTIISIDSSDSGSYICRAADSFGQSLSDSISLSAVNAILYDPSVQSDTLYAIEGDNFTLVCIASSVYAEAEVYWTLDGQRLTTSCTRSVFFGNQYTKTCLYTRTNVQRSDNSKVFFCLARVPGTDKQKKWTMSITVRPTNPVITRTSATVQVGSTVSWSCTTSGGNPTPTLTWQLDLTQVSNGGSFSIPASTVTEQTVNGYTTYTVTSTISWTLVSQDIGKLLYCKVSSLPAPSNSVASLVINNSITVTVTVEILNGDSVSANEGQPITFTCRVVGTGSITVNWFGPKLISGSKYTVIPYSSNSSQSTLTVSNLDSSDAGTYMCLARSSASSSDFSDSVTLAVTAPISVDITNGFTVTGTTGQSITFTCRVTGSGTITVFWIGLTGGQLLTNFKYTVGAYDTNSRQSNLTINSLTTSDAGTYTCRGSDSSGNTLVDTVQLIVTASLFVHITNGTTVTATQGQSVTLTCEVTGSGSISVMWIGPTGGQLFTNFKYNVGAYNSNTRQSTLTIYSGTTSDAGTYKCHASDSSGTQEDSTQLTFITLLTVTIDEGDSLSRPVGSDATITCSVSGSGTINVVWIGPFGNTLTSNGKYTVTSYNINTGKGTVTILGLSTSDSGSYICRATDGFGSTAQDSITLTAYAPLSVDITNGLTVTGTPGQSITLTCAVTGSGTITVIWIGLTGGQLLTNSKYTVGAYDTNSRQSNLTINSLTASDAGSYTCRGSDSSGNTLVDTAQLIVTAPLSVRITNGPTVTATQGQSVTLTCEVTGSGTISVMWIGPTGFQLFANFKYNVGAYNSNTRQSTLTINSAATSDAGTYKCRSSDNSGTQEDSTQLTFIAPPVISVSQQSYQVDEGKSVTLNVVVNSAATVSWSRNGNLITPGQNGYNLFSTNSPNLVIFNASVSHAGTYIFTASNTGGSSQSPSITLSVTAVPVVTVSPKPVTGYVGQSVTINCILTQVTSISDITILWYRNGIAVSKGGTYTWFDTINPNLQILNLDAIQHPGTYRCAATSSAGTGYDQTTLNVIDKPTLSAPTTSVTGNAGSTIAVPATVTGSLITSVMWSFNGISLTNDGVNGRFSWTNQNSTGPVDLLIRNLALSDIGTYVCTVRNAAGSNELTIRLTVNAVPIVTVSPKPVTGYVGQTVTINCLITQVISISGITIAWYRNSIAISKGSTYNWSDTATPNLQISNLDATQHPGTYRCTATSSIGTGFDETTLTVIDKPTLSAPTSTITGNEGSNFTLPATVTGSLITSVMWSFNGTSLTNDGVNGRFSWTNKNSAGPVDLMIRNLALSDTGTFVCTVRNAAGSNELTIRLTVIASQPIITIPQTQYYAEEGGNMTLQCNVQGSLINGVSWTRNNAQLQNGGHYSWTVGNSPHLRIINIAKSDTGNYVCSATNSAGGTATATTPINLDVQYGPVVTIDNIATTIPAGNPVILVCRVIANPKESSVVWTKAGLTTPLTSVSTGNSTNFVFASIALTDAGTYRCQATNMLTVTGVTGSQLRQNYTEITLFVQSTPTNVIIAEGSSISAQIGQTLRLTCSSDGSNPRYFWTFGSQNVSTSNYYTLNVNNRLQAGNYFCTAYNEHGSKRSNAIFVDVLYAPVGISGQEVSIEAMLNVSLTLNCTVNANPPNCSYTWYDGDTQTILKGPSTSNTYFVDMNRLSDFKVYRCQADNTVGTGQVRFTVKQVTDTGTFQTGASTNDKSTLSQAAIAGIILGIIFFILLVIIIIICCCTCGVCRKDDAKTKIAPSEKKTDILHQPIVAEKKKTSEQGSDPFLANRFQSKPESATYTSPVRQRAPDSYRISSREDEDSTRVPAHKPPHRLEPISSHREDRQRPQHKTPGSVVSAVSRKHVDLEEKGPSYGFEDEPRYTDLPYLKTIDYPGPIISFPNGETPQAFQIPSSRSTAMYDYEEPLTQNSLPSVREDTANLYENEDKNKKKRRKKKKRHHRHHHREGDQFGDEELYPEGPPGTNPYLEIKDYDDIEVVPGRATDTYNRYSDV